ncbi:ion transporter [Vibrio harveyi]|uniref:ion transporter n=1 Tax=Vibrio harveyi TaxID=669 RepID=UPI001EFCB67A|nr:ion transporter [Vibrio harveyi]MCG9233488.1 ion transporter [Vibrio harveyi]MCG9587520.1 ion transporter [Vibrio harveyi]
MVSSAAKRLPFRGIGDVTLSFLILVQCFLFVVETSLKNAELVSVVQITIDALFVLDLCGRIAGTGRAYWRSMFNVVDAAIVVISVVGHAFAPGLQSLTALRVIRLMRMFRILRLIPNIDHILRGIARALRASRGVFLMLLILLIFFSILGYLLFRTTIPSHFADPLIASYTVFSLFTVEGWNEVPSLVATNTLDYYLIRAYVIAVIIFGSFFALSLANAIFIDEMVMDNNSDLENQIDRLTYIVEKQSRQLEELKDLVKEQK